jgi:hypothetical protein
MPKKWYLPDKILHQTKQQKNDHFTNKLYTVRNLN